MILATLCLEVLKATGHTFKDPVQIEDWKLTLGMFIGGAWENDGIASMPSFCNHDISPMPSVFLIFGPGRSIKEAKSKGPYRQSRLASRLFQDVL